MKRIHAIQLFVFAVFSFLVVGLCSARRSSRSDEAECVKRSAHNKDFWGTFRITPSATTGDFGWKFTVKFSVKVQRLQIWHFEPQNPTSADGYTFELENKDWNYELDGGRTYEYPFTATVAEGKGRFLRCEELSFEPIDGDGSGFNEI